MLIGNSFEVVLSRSPHTVSSVLICIVCYRFGQLKLPLLFSSLQVFQCFFILWVSFINYRVLPSRRRLQQWVLVHLFFLNMPCKAMECLLLAHFLLLVWKGLWMPVWILRHQNCSVPAVSSGQNIPAVQQGFFHTSVSFSSKNCEDIAGVKEDERRRDYLNYVLFFFLPQFPVEGKKLKQSAAWAVSIWQRKTTLICSGQLCQNSLVSGDKKHQFFTANMSGMDSGTAMQWALLSGLISVYFQLGQFDICITHSSCSSLHCPCDLGR